MSAILGDAGDPAIRTRGLCGSAESWGRWIGCLCLASGLGLIVVVGLLGICGVELWVEAINILLIASGRIDCHSHWQLPGSLTEPCGIRWVLSLLRTLTACRSQM